MKKHFLVLVTCFTLSTFLYGQESAVTKKWSCSLNVGYMNTKIKNENIQNDLTLKSHNEANPFYGVQFLFQINPKYSFFTGVSYLKYSTVSESSGYFKAKGLVKDADGFYYYPMVETSLKQHRIIKLLSIPIGIRRNFSPNPKIGCFVEGGITANYTLSSVNEGDGFYVKKGLYPDPNYINVLYLVDDVYRYGFVEVNNRKTTTIQSNSFHISYLASFGFNLIANEQTQLTTRAYFTSSVFDLIKKGERDKDYIDVTGDNYSYKKTKLSALGLVIGLSF